MCRRFRGASHLPVPVLDLFHVNVVLAYHATLCRFSGGVAYACEVLVCVCATRESAGQRKTRQDHPSVLPTQFIRACLALSLIAER
jgi:hypothetical protein